MSSNPPAPPPPAPGAKLPDCAGLKALRDSGWTYNDIRTGYGVSDQSVARKLRDCGLSEQRFNYEAYLPPWKIQPRHRNNLHKQLRYAARLKAGDRLDIEPAKMQELVNWIEKMAREGLVVDYDEETGYSLVPRIERDEWYVRWPENP